MFLIVMRHIALLYLSALECPLQDRLAETAGALEVSVQHCFQLLNDTQTSLHFLYYSCLLAKRWHWNPNRLKQFGIEARACYAADISKNLHSNGRQRCESIDCNLWIHESLVYSSP